MVFAVPFAELYVYPKLIVPANPAETVQNIIAHKMLFLGAIFCYLITFICDVVVAWALYVLLVPVSKSISLLAALFRLMYAAISIFALVNLFTLYKLINNADYLTILGTDLLHAQVRLAHSEFGCGWSLAFFLFCIHLGLLGYLVYKSGYIPKVLGVLLVIAGLGYLIVFSFPRLQYGIFDDYFFGGSDIYALAFDKGLEDSRTELRVFFNPMLSPSLAIQGTNYLLSQTQV